MVRLIILFWVLMLFPGAKTVYAAQCFGGWNCQGYNSALEICIETQIAPGSGSCAWASTTDCSPSGESCDGGCIDDRCRVSTCDPVDGGWSGWGGWSGCSGCSQTSTRSCSNPYPSCGGADCSGDNSKTQSCGLVNGGWSGYSPDCNPACGQTQTRTCTSPAPACYGADCSGSSTNTCSNSDNGSPGETTVVSPDGTSANPDIIVTTKVDLVWNQNASTLTDGYNVELYTSNGNNIWNTTLTARSITTTKTNTLSPGVYYWRIRAYNNTCDSDYGPWSSNYYFRINSPPVVNSITITNNIGTTLGVEAGNQNHICQSTIYDSSEPRKVRFLVNASDPDGGAQINLINLTWHGNIYGTTLSAVNVNNRTGIVDITFTGTDNDGGVYDVGATAVDIYGSRDGLRPRSFKVWNCQVPVSGTLYDGSAGQSCPGTGFTIPVDNRLEFSSLIFYKGLGDPGNVTMTTSLPSSYGLNNLIWGKEYLPLFNGGDTTNIDGSLKGTNRITRLIDLGVGTTRCPAAQFNLTNLISAYTANPRAQVDFSFIRDQEGWFQVGGGGVKAKIDIGSGVPVTATSNRALCVSAINADNGLISYGRNFENINGFNDASAYGIPKNWWTSNNTNDSNSYGYQNFYNSFYVEKGVGVTGTDWSTHPSEGVYFVKGNLNINIGYTLASDKSLLVIVGGKIDIASTVKSLDGIYIADGGIDALGISPNQLVINGLLYSKNTIRLGRSFENKRLNNETPAIRVNYQPNLLFNLPGSLMRVLSGWREE